MTRIEITNKETEKTLMKRRKEKTLISITKKKMTEITNKKIIEGHQKTKIKMSGILMLKNKTKKIDKEFDFLNLIICAQNL